MWETDRQAWERDFVPATGDGATINAAVQRVHDQMFESSFMSPPGAAGVQDACPDPAWHEEHQQGEFLAGILQLWPDAEQTGWSHEGFDRLVDLALSAYDAPCCPDRITRGVELLVGPADQLQAKLDEYGTTGHSCSCKDAEHHRPRRCKHQIALLMRARLRQQNLYPQPVEVPWPTPALMPWD